MSAVVYTVVGGDKNGEVFVPLVDSDLYWLVEGRLVANTDSLRRDDLGFIPAGVYERHTARVSGSIVRLLKWRPFPNREAAPEVADVDDEA
jgi:hypothetical protein